MNGKAAKMLRKFRRSDRKSKAVWYRLTHIERGQVRYRHENNEKMVYLDFLPK